MIGLRLLEERVVLALGTLFTALFIAGIAGGAEGEAMRLPTDPARLVVETKDGERTFSVEIADDAVERARGLMFRQGLGTDHGMLFVFEQTRPVTFWMKNTPLPLDLVFIDEAGTVRGVRQGEPFSEAMIPSSGPVRFVLELEAGTAARQKIADGDRVRHPIVDATATETP